MAEKEGGGDPRAQLPAIAALLASSRGAELLARYPRAAVVQALREEVDRWRGQIARGQELPQGVGDQVLAGAAARLAAAWRPSLRPLINATGVIIHTNLGRSVLAESAARAVYDIARSYSNLEADLETGRRSSRHVHIEERLRQVVGAPAGAVFNNNAAAVMLALAAIARGREVIVSRGELVEIGGAFRVPDVIVQSGCILREVGTTNRTHLRDYEQAIGEQTAAILRVHQSNYRIIGFTKAPELGELVALAHDRGLPLIEDLGSGAVVDLAPYGAGAEPTVAQSLAAGADLITFSGDKLLGGPQCGVVVGREDLIALMKKHPLARAVRVDKMTIAALAATLDLLADPTRALQEIPTLRAATEPLDQVKARAEALLAAIQGAGIPGVTLSLQVDRSARVGGGSLPEEELDTAAVHIRLPQGPSPNELARKLRLGDPPVYPRVTDDAVVLDARTIFPEQVQATAEAVVRALHIQSSAAT